MNNKETAIALLSEFKEKHTFYGKDHERDMNDTFDLAIKALEQTEVKGDLISREALKEIISESVSKYSGQYSTDMLNMWGLFAKIIDNAPTVERPTGEWIEANGTYYCSQCKHYAFDRQRFDFCQDCGADMRGGKE